MFILFSLMFFIQIYQDQVPLQVLRLELGNLVASINSIVTSLQDGEFDVKDEAKKVFLTLLLLCKMKLKRYF